PNLIVLRPDDAAETAEEWRVSVSHEKGPIALILTRQKLGWVDRAEGTGMGAASGVAKGAYVLADASSAKVVLMGSGSEVGLLLKAQAKLKESGIAARVVSVPSMELFAA